MPKKNINWPGVDLTRDAKELAAELGCTVAMIYRARKMQGITVPKKSGGPRPGFGGKQEGAGRPRKTTSEKQPMPANVFVRLDADEIKNIDAIAEEMGITRSKVLRAAAREFIEKRKSEK